MSTPVDADQHPVPDEVVAFCRASGYGAVVGVEVLLGGMASSVGRLSTASGARLVVKHGAGLPADLYPLEADGLATLAGAETLRVPGVHAVGHGYLLLEDLGPVPSAEPPAPDWAVFGRGLANQHQRRAARFGYDTDNYLGQKPQRNPWTDDGHEFFATHRLLRYLPEPKAEECLTAADRAAVERIARRLPDLVPAAPPSLLHGDLWHANMLPATPYGPALIDPAVHYGWPEADLSMAHQTGDVVPPEFFAAYAEVSPLADGWEERMPLLNLRELPCMVAHFGDEYGSVGRIREVLARFG